MDVFLRVFLCFFLVATYSHYSQQQNARHRRQGIIVGESCTTPRSVAGICVVINECPLLLDYLVNKRNQPGVKEYLQASVCGRQGSEIIACCPIEKSVNFESDGECQTPRSVPGKCVNIRQCPELLQMLQRYKDQGVTDYLRKSRCGFDKGDPKVCCPKEGSSNNPSVPTQQPAGGGSSRLPGPDVCGLSDSPNNRVVNGQPASLGSWPWMVALGYSSPSKPLDWLCGGSLINDRYVLTAAHCVTNLGRRKLFMARLGDLNLDDSVADKASPINVPVEKAIGHENYNAAAHTIDIALVKLKDRVQYSKLIRPICLPSANTFRSDLTGYSPFIIGWGATSYRGPSSTHLQEAQVDITDIDSCANAYKNIKGATIDNRVFCAQSPLGKDACQGDSGGPLILPKQTETTNYYLIGVVSYGYKCAEPGFPGIYSKVELYLDWIKKNMTTGASLHNSAGASQLEHPLALCKPVFIVTILVNIFLMKLFSDSGGTCTTPRNIAGVCINIRQCPLHLDYLTNRLKEPGIVKYLQDAVCYKQGSQVITCCPEETSNQCETPKKVAGKCISIKKCSELLNMLERYKEPGVAELLRASRCGTNRGDPMVCCPDIPSPTEQSGGVSDQLGEGDSCQTPRKAAGNCISIKKCPELLKMLDRFREPGVSEFLRASQCRVNRGDPIVCCPKTSSSNPPSGGSNSLPGTDVCGMSKFFPNKVVNGKPAALGAWPWMVALGYSSPRVSLAWKCGGSLINNRYVVTAAHCVANFRTMKLVMARVGDLDLNNAVDDRATPMDIPVEKTITHENYDPEGHTVDIALVKLSRSVQFTDLIKPICLPSKNLFEADLTGYSPFIAGWGASIYKGPSRTDLQEAQIDITDNEGCAEAYQNVKGATVDDRVICAYTLGKDACQGDSGGPLMLPKYSGSVTNFYLIGIVSYGYKCAEPGFPGVYTRVELYTDWIKRKIS